MKLCRDCLHVEEGRLSNRCRHPSVALSVTYPYDGSEHLHHPSASVARSLTDCGPEGVLWEPRNVGFS
jgi:hypothetical protein